MKIISVHWLSGNFGTLGIVVGEDTITKKKKAYIGKAFGANEEHDTKHVAEQGSPLLANFLKEILRDLEEGSMGAVLDYKSGEKPIIRITAENDDEKNALKLIWEQGARLVSYNGREKLALTCGKVEEGN